MAYRLPAGNPMENEVPSSSTKFLLPSKRTKDRYFKPWPYHAIADGLISINYTHNKSYRASNVINLVKPELEDSSTKEHCAGQANARLFIVHPEHS
ncbi:hypothetical protein [Granulicella sp. L46]|uniref:hypothetical protein n=1 Tax=Granulicella sp. L46 TaxID=1641865 RepID=UPI00131EB273|nr:hypothetical protein [Granulicella sp. L46]